MYTSTVTISVDTEIPSNPLKTPGNMIFSIENIEARPSPNSRIEWPAQVPEPNLETYPAYISLLNVIQTWNPDDPEPPPLFKETLQHFNYSNLEERKMAELYRNAELPFKLYDIPDIHTVTTRWTDAYLTQKLTDKHPHVEKSVNNHFMYWTHKRGVTPNWEPPTEIVDMSFTEWLAFAKLADQNKLKNDTVHYYFMSSAATGDHGRTFIAQDLPFFSTRYGNRDPCTTFTPLTQLSSHSEENFFISNVRANKGIQVL